MNLYFRFFWLILRNLILRPKFHFLDPILSKFRVSLVDLDFNFHMNNGRYLSLMDLGRLDLMMKSGVLWKLVFSGYYPVVTSEMIRFRRSLQFPQKFRLETQVVGWDKKDFYLMQRFYHGSELSATGFIKGRFRKWGEKSSILTEEIIAIIEFQDWNKTVEVGELKIVKSQMPMEKFARSLKKFEFDLKDLESVSMQ